MQWVDYSHVKGNDGLYDTLTTWLASSLRLHSYTMILKVLVVYDLSLLTFKDTVTSVLTAVNVSPLKSAVITLFVRLIAPGKIDAVTVYVIVPQ